MKTHDPIRGFCMPCYNGRHDDCRELVAGNTICCGCGHHGHVEKALWPEWVKPAPLPPVEVKITGGWGDGAPAPRKRTIKRR